MEKKYFFDNENIGFYVYPDSQNIPDAAIEINYDLYRTFAGVAWPEGKILGVDKKGMPAWLDAPPPTQEELNRSAQSKKDGLINEANDYMNSKQWPGKAAIGRLKGDELTNYNIWLDYLDELDGIDVGSAPINEWPNKPS